MMKQTITNIAKEVTAAEKRIRPYILKTPLLPSPLLSELAGANVFLKMESEQYTGSFKARGSMNTILSLTPEELKKGVVTASTGNHGKGVAKAVQQAKATGIVFLPEHAEQEKEDAIAQYGMKTLRYGTNSALTEEYAKDYAEKHGMTWISPYNDARVIAGQGTIGIEILEQLPDVDHILATIGGGGLISGIASYMHSQKAETEIVGCQPENSPEMYLSIQAGRIVEPIGKPTLSDTSAGGVEKGSITYDMCKELVKHFCLVSEDEIRDAMRLSIERLHKLIEGAAAVTIASLLQEKERYTGKNVVLIMCGGNVHADVIRDILG